MKRSFLPISLVALAALVCVGATAPCARAQNAPGASGAQTPEEQLAAASALFDATRYDAAAERLSKFLSANPKHPKAGAAALALARCRVELEQWALAVPAYEKAIASGDPAVLTTARLGLGEAALRSGKFDKAQAALAAAVKASLPAAQAAPAWYWLGEARFQLGQFADAEDAYLTVTRNYGRSDWAGDAVFGSALAALRQNKDEPARQRLELFLDQYPGSPDRGRARFLLAQMDLDAKRYAEARTGFEALLEPSATAVSKDIRQSAEEGLVRALLELKDYGAVTTRLQTLLATLPAGDARRLSAQLTLGHALYRQTDYAAALPAYREAAKSSDAAVGSEGMYWAANTLLALNRPAEAGAQFFQLATRFPKSALAPRAALKAGDALAAAQQAKAAADAYRKVSANYPQAPEAAAARKALTGLVSSAQDPAALAATLENAQSPEVRAQGTLRLARLQLEAKKYAAAAAPLQTFLAAKPAPAPAVGAEAQYLLGLAREGLSQSAAAAAALSEAVRLAPTADWAGDAQGRLAWLYLDTKKPALAQKAADAVLARNPDADAVRQARLALVQAHLDQQHWDAALQTCDALLADNPPPDTIATVLYTQAWVSEKQNKTEQTQTLWTRLLAEHPQSRYAETAALRIADARLKSEDYEGARGAYADFLTAHPSSTLAPEARFKLGNALYGLERWAEAAAAWDQVADNKQAGDYAPEALYWSGVALDKAGQKAAAIARLSRLVSQYPTHARVANARVRLAALKAVAGT